MKLVDAHIHLSDQEYSHNIKQTIQQAKNANVTALVSNSVDLKTSIRSLKLAQQFPKTVYAALGIHPTSVANLTENELQQTTDLITKNQHNQALVAIGEIGLDAKYTQTRQKQLETLDTMLHLAEKLLLPVIIHSRGTTAQIVDTLSSYNPTKTLLHWFSNPSTPLSKAIENGFYISEGAPALFSNDIRTIIRRIPIENLLTETDGPVRFSQPPFEGQRTTPAIIPTIITAMAKLRNTQPETLANRIANNFEDFFGIKLN